MKNELTLTKARSTAILRIALFSVFIISIIYLFL